MTNLVIAPGTQAAIGDCVVELVRVESVDCVVVQNVATGAVFSARPGVLRAIKSSVEQRPATNADLDLTTIEANALAQACQWRDLLDELSRQSCSPEALLDAAGQMGCSVRTVYRRLSNHRFNGCASSQLSKRRGRKPGTRLLPAEIERIVTEHIESCWLSKQRPSKARVHLEVRLRCNREGIAPPSLATVQRRIDAVDKRLTITKRMGKKMARDHLDPAAAPFEINRPFELLQLDHALVDLILVDQTFRRPIGRPWLTIAIDCYTRTVAGIHLGLERPSAISVAACITNAYLPKDGWLTTIGVDSSWPVWGRWLALHLDNARELRGNALRAGCSVNQIILDYRPVATPHYGGYIERLIGTFSKEIHLLSGTTFSSPKERGRYRSEERATMTFPEFLRWFALAVQSYHNRPHSGLDGATPLQAWITSLSANGSLALPSIIPDPRRFVLDFLPFTKRAVARDGIHIFGTRYFSPALGGYIGQGEQLTVKFDPRDISKVYVQQPSGGYIDTPYADLRRPPVTLAEHKFVRRQLRMQGKDLNSESLVFDAIEKQRAITESAAKKSKVARRALETRKTSSAIATSSAPEAESSDTAKDQTSMSSQLVKLAFDEWS